MHIISDFNAHSGRSVISRHPTMEAAEQRLHEMGVVYYERDESNPGCGDALMRDGRILAINPEA